MLTKKIKLSLKKKRQRLKYKKTAKAFKFKRAAKSFKNRKNRKKKKNRKSKIKRKYKIKGGAGRIIDARDLSSNQLLEWFNNNIYGIGYGKKISKLDGKKLLDIINTAYNIIPQKFENDYLNYFKLKKILYLLILSYHEGNIVRIDNINSNELKDFFISEDNFIPDIPIKQEIDKYYDIIGQVIRKNADSKQLIINTGNEHELATNDKIIVFNDINSNVQEFDINTINSSTSYGSYFITVNNALVGDPILQGVYSWVRIDTEIKKKVDKFIELLNNGFVDTPENLAINLPLDNVDNASEDTGDTGDTEGKYNDIKIRKKKFSLMNKNYYYDYNFKIILNAIKTLDKEIKTVVKSQDKILNTKIDRIFNKVTDIYNNIDKSVV